jgi:hypothetical protein
VSKLRIAVALVAAALVGAAGFALGRARAPQVVVQTKTVEVAKVVTREVKIPEVRTVTVAGPVRTVVRRERVLEPNGNCTEVTVVTREAGATETKRESKGGTETVRAEERTRTQATVARDAPARDRWGIWARARSPLLSVSPSFDSAGGAVRVVGPLWLGAGWQVGNKVLLEGRVQW